MPTELVLLTEQPVTTEQVLQAARPVMPDARFVSYRGGEIGQFVDAEGVGVLSVFPSRPVSVPREAAGALHDPPARFSVWTDLTIPWGDTTAGRRLAAAIAAAVGGTVHERR
jgi:hypothetical protein